MHGQHGVNKLQLRGLNQTFFFFTSIQLCGDCQEKLCQRIKKSQYVSIGTGKKNR